MSETLSIVNGSGGGNSGGVLDTLEQSLDQLAVLPHVVFKVLEVTALEDLSISDVERVITVDPGFCSKVLVAANSAQFGLPRRVSSIHDALSFLGYRGVRGIALTVGAFDLFLGKTDVESIRRRNWWRQSLDTAVCARWLATRCKLRIKDDAYTCGLLHLLGKTILDRVPNYDYSRVMQLIEVGVTDSVAEREVYGCDHVQAAIVATRKWGLPAELQEGISYLTPSTWVASPTDQLKACTSLAASLAQATRLGLEDHRIPDESRWPLNLLGIDPESVPDLLEGAHAAICEAEEAHKRAA